ncbi:unnamed protein product, partial [Oppiella nova]
MGIRNIIIDVPRENIHKVLKHAQQVDMLSDYHNYFFTSLDVHTVDLEDYQYGGTNISGFNLVDENSKEYLEVIRDWQNSPPRYPNWKGESLEQLAKTEVALVYDAVRLFAKALHDLDQTQSISIRPISCETEEPWIFGNAVTNYMRMINIDG